MSGVDYCAIGIQKITNMPYNETFERNFYFGDFFFKQFVGVFDLENKVMGLAKSVHAEEGTDLICPGTSCEVITPEPEPIPEPEPEPIPPTPTPDPPAPTPTPPDDSSDDHLMWLWIVIGLSALILILLAISMYYFRKSRKQNEFNAMLYAQTPGEKADLIGEDVHRTSQFQDHEDIMREVDPEGIDSTVDGDPQRAPSDISGISAPNDPLSL